MTDGWLKISTDGFASFNKSRRPAHLVKELVRNALDAVGDRKGHVDLDYSHYSREFRITCRDDGTGIADLSAMAVVYLTFKTDSHLKRGRFGRGFKEILSVARSAAIQSGTGTIEFVIEDGRQVTRSRTATMAVMGTEIVMTFDWPAQA